MIIQQLLKEKGKDWVFLEDNKNLHKPLVLVFGNRYMLEEVTIYEEIKNIFPDGEIVFGSTSGEIIADSVIENSISIIAIEFNKSSFVVKNANIKDFNTNSFDLGEALYNKLPEKGLRHIFVVSEGSTINGSALIEGLEKDINPEVSITGGLCGDGPRFEKTLASYNCNPKMGEVIVVGLYGEDLEISCSNYGGWTSFGPERLVTNSRNNILYQLDSVPALELYKTYLGDKAKDLPEAALFYPLSVKAIGEDEILVRTILNINEEDNSMILAGDIPIGSKVQLMMSTVDDIVEGSYKAAKQAMKNRKSMPELALLVSCVGRKLVMDQRTEEEVEEVINVIGKQAKVAGFYSYGEMAPLMEQNSCKLHNQTMTLTLISE